MLRLTTDAPLAYLLDEQAFVLEEPITLILGPDETLARPIAETGVDYISVGAITKNIAAVDFSMIFE